MSEINWLAVVFLDKLMKMKNFFVSHLPTAMSTNKKRKAKQGTHTTGFSFYFYLYIYPPDSQEAAEALYIG